MGLRKALKRIVKIYRLVVELVERISRIENALDTMVETEFGLGERLVAQRIRTAEILGRELVEVEPYAEPDEKVELVNAFADSIEVSVTADQLTDAGFIGWDGYPPERDPAGDPPAQ